MSFIQLLYEHFLKYKISKVACTLRLSKYSMLVPTGSWLSCFETEYFYAFSCYLTPATTSLERYFFLYISRITVISTRNCYFYNTLTNTYQQFSSAHFPTLTPVWLFIVCSFPQPYLLAHLSLHLHPYREREAQLEVEQQRKVAELKEQFAAESKQWQEQMKALKDQSQQKLNYLAKLWVFMAYV